jgi:predicted ATP-binding protein involved in virulence
MIDELDLYLHPRWQQHILNDLKAAFPLIQFIVSSHSPFIIQSVYSRNIITLDGHNDAADPNRRSIEEIVLQEMNLDTVRSLAYQKMVAQAEVF